MNHDKELTPELLRVHKIIGGIKSTTSTPDDRKKLLIEALHHIAEIYNITLDIPNEKIGDNIDDLLEMISIKSGVRIQKINLTENWWKKDLGVLLAFINEKPCVLVPMKNGGYECSTMVDKIRLTAKDYKQIANYAYLIIEPFNNRIRTIFDIFKFSFRRIYPEIRSVIYLQIFLSLITMSIPLFFTYFINNFSILIESNQLNILWISLIINSIIFLLFSVNQSLVILHLRYKIQAKIEPALWDRLLKLNMRFFHQYNSGDVAFRASVIASVQELIGQSTILSLFSIISTLTSFMLMCFFSVPLALLSLLGFIILIFIIYILSQKFLIYQRKVYDYLIKQAGFIFQVINGIIKFKVTASEFRAFNIWSNYFSNLLLARYKADQINMYIHIIHGSLITLMTTLLFGMYFILKDYFSVGDFVAFNAAFTQFFSALITLSMFMFSVIKVIPIFEQSLIILESKIEPIQHGGSHVQLEGKIEIKNLSFQYEDSQPPIFKNLNLTIHPGEIIGITGSSGCGKSTLFKILLGLEKPADGQIFYDDINIDMINLSILRQQVGIVTQKSVLVPGTILENIIGQEKHLTRNDAWDMIGQLGLSQMISSFPMDMDTLISEGLQSLSGGEIQRIVLARSLIKKPKILFLDEATSALDNQSQFQIHDYLRQLNITQVIIAHRLSTLKHASRILVINDGKIIQNGNFEQLINEPGYFSALAKLQL